MKNIGKYAGVMAGVGILLASVFALAKEPVVENPGNFSATTAKQKSQAIEQRRIQALQNFATSTAKQRLEDIEQRAKEAVQNLERIREQAQGKVQQVREKLQEKMNEIRDEQKKRQAQQIEEQFGRLDQAWTNHFSLVLNRLDAILEKIKTRADKAAANGQDVSDADAAIKAAQTAISTARAAVEAQAEKTYTADITAVNSGVATTTTAVGQNQLMVNLRAQFKTLRNQLSKDLFALRDGLMKEARMAVQNAFQALSKIPKVDEEPAATSTPSS